MAARPASLKVRALQWLAQREHSPQELRGKLLRLLLDRRPDHRADKRFAHGSDRRPDERGSTRPLADGPSATGLSSAAEPLPAPDVAAAAAEVDELLLWLSQHGYLSPQRFIESRVQARQARFGNVRIQRELKQHGLALDASERQALRDTEFERACEVWRKKYGPADPPAPADAAARVRQMRFLTGRGFSPEVIHRVLAQARPTGEVFEADLPETMRRRHTGER